MKKKRLIPIFPLIMFVLSILSTTLTSAQTPPTIYLEEETFTFDIGVGDTYNVTIWVKNCSALMMFQVYLTFNDDIINITQFHGPVTNRTDAVRAWPSDDLGGRAWDPEYVFYGGVGGSIGNPTYYHLGPGQGAVKLGDVLLAERTLDPNVAYKLACIEFNVTGTPSDSCTLGINNTDTYLYTFEGPIPGVIKIDSEVVIVPEFSLFSLLLTFMSLSLITIVFTHRISRKIKS